MREHVAEVRQNIGRLGAKTDDVNAALSTVMQRVAAMEDSEAARDSRLVLISACYQRLKQLKQLIIPFFYSSKMHCTIHKLIDICDHSLYNQTCSFRSCYSNHNLPMIDQYRVGNVQDRLSRVGDQLMNMDGQVQNFIREERTKSKDGQMAAIGGSPKRGEGRVSLLTFLFHMFIIYET